MALNINNLKRNYSIDIDHETKTINIYSKRDQEFIFISDFEQSEIGKVEDIIRLDKSPINSILTELHLQSIPGKGKAVRMKLGKLNPRNDVDAELIEWVESLPK